VSLRQAGRPLKKVMRIYFDRRERERKRERERERTRRREATREPARAAFVNDECVVASWRKATRHSSAEGWSMQGLKEKKRDPLEPLLLILANLAGRFLQRGPPARLARLTCESDVSSCDKNINRR